MAKPPPLFHTNGGPTQSATNNLVRRFGLTQLFRLGAVAFAAWLISLPLTIASGSLGTILGALLGPLILCALPHSSRALQLRFGAAAILAFVFAGTGLLLATVLRNGSEVGSLLSASATASGNPLSLYSAGEFIAGFTLAAAFCGSLHLLSQRGAVGRIG